MRIQRISRRLLLINKLARDGAGEKGFSFVELLFAVAISGMFLTAVVSSWYFSSTVWKEESAKGRLRYNVERVMERMKNEIRLTDGNRTLFYPQGGSTYTAISFSASTPDAGGYLTFSNNVIQWDKTVIYHIYPTGGKYELRKTIFNSFNPSVSGRQAQLDSVVANGQGPGGVTTILFSSDSMTLQMTPSSPTFDGYGSAVTRSENTNFGSIPLTPGNHTVRFEVTGKNAASTGYQLGIDTLYFAPSGGGQEAEFFMPPYASSGDTAVKENMSAYGNNVWGGNHQLAYLADAPGDFVTIQVNNDQWLESNFSSFSRNKISIDGTDPHLTIESRESQSKSSVSWQAETQTGAQTSGSASLPNKSVRTVLAGSQLTEATMIRIKFLASSSASLTINSAYFGPRNGASANFASAPIQLYFNNGPVAEGGEDGVGALGAVGPTGIVIPAGHHAWSNWFEYSVPASGAPDHLVSVFIPNDGASANAARWTPADLTAVNSYLVDADQAAGMTDWATLPGYATDPSVYGTARVGVWVALGTATSQIYDTKMTAPAYNQIKWTSVLPVGASASVKVRSSSNSNMAGAANWNALTAHTSSPASLTGLGNLRYVQYQFALQAVSPYTSFPEVDDVLIDWPGATTLVELGGYYTKKPDYGVFKILVDGNPTVKALEVKLSASDTFRSRTFGASLNAEVKSRNTGK